MLSVFLLLLLSLLFGSDDVIVVTVGVIVANNAFLRASSSSSFSSSFFSSKSPSNTLCSPVLLFVVAFSYPYLRKRRISSSSRRSLCLCASLYLSSFLVVVVVVAAAVVAANFFTAVLVFVATEFIFFFAFSKYIFADFFQYTNWSVSSFNASLTMSSRSFLDASFCGSGINGGILLFSSSHLKLVKCFLTSSNSLCIVLVSVLNTRTILVSFLLFLLLLFANTKTLLSISATVAEHSSIVRSKLSVITASLFFFSLRPSSFTSSFLFSFLFSFPLFP